MNLEQKILRRKVLELPSKLYFAVNRRTLVANELKNADIVVEAVEKVDGVKPHLLIRIKKVIHMSRRKKL